MRGGDIHTNDSLRVAGTRCPQAELAQVVLGLLREGIQPCFGALSGQCVSEGGGYHVEGEGVGLCV